MKLRELIIVEDGEASGATADSTTSSDIATVAYPLFVRGKSNKAKRKNARAAVGQKYVPGPAGIGQGVFEGWREQLAKAAIGLASVGAAGDAAAIAGAIPTPSHQQAMYKAMADSNKAEAKRQAELKAKADAERLKTNTDLVDKEQRKNHHSLSNNVGEAHVLGNDSVIYRLDRENPMSNTEVAVIGGAGRYSLKALRDKARREAAQLAQDLSIEHGGAFRRSADNIKQLTNTINTIVAAYNELARLRRKGGRGSRGITDEDTNFIRECIRVVEQATQNYRLMEGLTKEPDPQGYAKDILSNPKYAIVVNTPGDLDWYKIGTYWNNNKIDPHEFGQDDSDTVLVAQGEEEYKEMLAKVKQMGLTYKIIGGTNDQPEIHDKA